MADDYNTTYIGSTCNRQRRWQRHRSELNCGRHHNVFLQRSWDKYSADNFEFYILETPDDNADLVQREQVWFDKLALSRRLFNVSGVAAAPTRGRQHTPEAIAKIRAANLGRTLSEESRLKISKANRGANHPFYGKHLSDVHRQHISEANKGRAHTEATKETMSRAAGARVATKEGISQMKAIGTLNIKSYPAFIHQETGKIIPAGINLSGMCHNQGLDYKHMWGVAHRKRRSHQGWMLLDQDARAPSRRGSQYPAFRHRETGEIIPAGRNLTKLCKERGLDPRNMWSVVTGRYGHHQGWELIETEEAT